MVQKILTSVCLQGTDEYQMYIDGKVSEEIRRMNEENAKKMEALQEQLKATEAHRNRLLAKRRDAMIQPARRDFFRRMARRFINKIQVVWAMVWYVNRELGKKILDWGLKHGLWEEA